MSLPSNLDAEQAVLGAALFDASVLDGLTLSAEHFFDPTHGAFFDELRARRRADHLADATAMIEWAEKVWKEIGGKRYLNTLSMAASSSLYLDGYAEMIRAAAARRQAIMALREALARAESGDDLLEVIAEAEGSMHALTAGDDSDSSGLCDADGFFQNLDRPGLETGIEALDRRLGGLFRKELTILAGRPSMGKTAVATQIGRNIARRGAVVHFSSLEMGKDGLQARSISAATFNHRETRPIPYSELRNGARNIDRSLLERLASGLPRTFRIDERPAQTLAQLEQAARATRRRFKRLDLIIVDYLQLMRAIRSDGRVQEVSEISAGLKAIAKRLDVPVLALSQLSRQVESRENKKPTLSDLRESGSIEQDADVVMFVYREAYYHDRAEPDASERQKWLDWAATKKKIKRHLEVITAKQRMGEVGSDHLEAWLEFDVVTDRGAA